jgi:F-type H+-transporting ATPase subunit epsilon
MATADIHDTAAGTKAPVGKIGAGQIQCVVVTPEKILLDEVVEFVSLPLFDGELGVLHGRAPLIGRLGYGELRIRTGGLTRRYFVDGGFAQVRDDVVTVLTNRAIPADRIVVEDAREQLAAASERVATTDADRAEKTRAIDRARAMLRVASHRA